MKKNLLFCAAILAFLPAFALAANFAFYAFTGADFLPESSGGMSAARYVVFSVSIGFTACILLFGVELEK